MTKRKKKYKFPSDDLEDYFKSCREINEKVSKAEKIKINDPLLNEDCLICMEKYKLGELKRKIPKCSHYFHKKCIDKWLKKKGSCPVCRCNLLEDTEDAKDAVDAEDVENCSKEPLNEEK